VDAEGLREVFEPVGRITLKRMFGGFGVYLDGLIVALEFDGDIFMKTDDVNRGLYESRGSRPFSYVKKGEEQMITSYWSLPASAFDNADELREMTRSSLAASERAMERKAKPKRRQAEP
jgi:DNA transformation protein and related proteins